MRGFHRKKASSFDDLELRMAESLSGSQNPLSAKLAQVLGASYADSGVRAALESLDDKLTQNTPTTRRQLRAALELQDIQSSGTLLVHYEQVIAVPKL
jgi:hypothetical protein